jgi:putative pyruvate formate lyase activating enzyme
MFNANYVRLHEEGELIKRAETAKAMLRQCNLCPHNCGVDRTAGEKGVCRAGSEVRISGAAPHFGEERVLTGSSGSGTVFFSLCNLHCIFCQNYEISHLGHGQVVSVDRLADLFIRLQHRGCHNINLVSPTHYVPQILSALCLAVDLGLRIPLVYNTGGFDSLEALALLDGVVDIYMPDIKFFCESSSERYLGTRLYPAAVREAVTVMHRQVGDLVIDSQGLATRGLLVRHLIMPDHAKDTEAILQFLAESMSTDTYVNIMAQYSPSRQAKSDGVIGRIPSSQEIMAAHQAASRFGLRRARAH